MNRLAALFLLALPSCAALAGLDGYGSAADRGDAGPVDDAAPERAADRDALADAPAQDAVSDASACACVVDVPMGWTFVAMGGCDGEYAGGTATFCTEVSGQPVFTCLPSRALASCEAGLGPPLPSATQILCVQQAGDMPCPSGSAYFDRHGVYAPTNGCATLANPTTICCAPNACK